MSHNFEFDTDDNFSFAEPGTNTKLNNLFAADSATSLSSSASFKYQPIKKEDGNSSSEASTEGHTSNSANSSEGNTSGITSHAGYPVESVSPQLFKQSQFLHFTTSAQLYKHGEGGKFDNLGAVGSVIVANLSTQQFQLLCYKSNKEYLVVANIRNDFQFVIQNERYGSFSDDRNLPWSLLFRSNDDAIQFAVHVAFAKHFSAPNFQQQVTTVDLGLLSSSLGNSNNTPEGLVEQGSKLSLKYTGWLLQFDVNSGLPKLGKVFDSNVQSDKVFRIKIGASHAIKGMEKGLLGMKKQVGNRRFMVIPSQFGYGASSSVPQIPPHSTLCFQVEICKSRKSQATTAQSITPELQDVQESTLHQQQQDYQMNSNQSSNSQAMPGLPQQHNQTSHLTTQDDLKQRVAKYGVSIVPAQPLQPPLSNSQTQQPQANYSMSSPSPQFPTSQQHQQLQQQQLQQLTSVNRSPSPSPYSQQRFQPISVEGHYSSHSPAEQQIALLQQQLQMLQKSFTNQQSSQQQRQQGASSIESPGINNISNSSSHSEQQSVQGNKKKKQEKKKKIEEERSDDSSDGEESEDDEKHRENKDKVSGILKKIENKIDDLNWSKLFGLSNMDKDRNEWFMSGVLLMQNIQHLVTTCDQQKKELEEERNKVDELLDKISKLRQRNERYAQEISAQLNSGSDAQDLEYFRLKFEREQKLNGELKNKQQQLQSLLDTEREDKKDLSKENSQLSIDNQNLQKQVDKLQMKISTLQMEHKQELDEIKESKERYIAQLTSSDKEKYNRILTELYDEKNKSKGLQEELNSVRLTIKERDSEIESLQQNNSTSQTELKNQFKKIFQERVEDLNEEHEKDIANLKQMFRERFQQERESVPNLLKLSMTQIFNTLSQKISTEDDTYYRGESILSFFKSLMRAKTMKSLQLLEESKSVQEFTERLEEALNEDEDSELTLDPEHLPQPTMNTTLTNDSPVLSNQDEEKESYTEENGRDDPPSTIFPLNKQGEENTEKIQIEDQINDADKDDVSSEDLQKNEQIESKDGQQQDDINDGDNDDGDNDDGDNSQNQNKDKNDEIPVKENHNEVIESSNEEDVQTALLDEEKETIGILGEEDNIKSGEKYHGEEGETEKENTNLEELSPNITQKQTESEIISEEIPTLEKNDSNHLDDARSDEQSPSEDQQHVQEEDKDDEEFQQQQQNEQQNDSKHEKTQQDEEKVEPNREQQFEEEKNIENKIEEENPETLVIEENKVEQLDNAKEKTGILKTEGNDFLASENAQKEKIESQEQTKKETKKPLFSFDDDEDDLFVSNTSSKDIDDDLWG